MIVHLMYFVDLESHSEIHDEIHEALLMADYIFQKITLPFYKRSSSDDLIELQVMLFSLRGSSLQSLSLWRILYSYFLMTDTSQSGYDYSFYLAEV